MYATVRPYEDVPDTSEVVRRINEFFVPMIREIEGFVDYHVIDAGDGAMVSISILEDRSGEEESNWRAGEFVGASGSLD
jgi:hypothetical protein